MDPRVQRLCAWSGPVFLVLFVIGFWFVGGLVPPPKPTDSAAQVAAFYQDHQGRLQAGMLIAMVSMAFFAPFIVLLTLQMKRANPRLAPLAYTQLVCAIALLLMILLPLTLIGIAAFRPDRPPALTQLLNDAAFLSLFWVFSTPTLEYVSLALMAFLDRSDNPLFPHWVGWFDLAVAAIFATGAPVIFVKHGPFAWDGALAFWAVLVAFGLWVWVTFWYMWRAINRPTMTSS
jgi:hypothetical protein